jgi:cell cycle checkpoint protein
MTLPPAKRQRKLILSDDEEEPVVKTRRAPARLLSGSTTKLSDRTTANQNKTPTKPKAKAATKASPKSSPGKAKKRSTKEEKESRSLHNFFGKATEEQRWARKDKTPPTIVEDVETEDAIEDDSLDEAFVELAYGEGDEDKVLDRRKTSSNGSRNGSLNPVRNGCGSTQKFAKPSKPAIREPKEVSANDADILSRPWAERFTPTSLEELAVHKKKVTDVQNWLNSVLQGRDRRVCSPW